MRWLLLIALLVASNVATFYVTKKNARPKGHSVESVLAEVRTATGIVMMGDSLVEDAKFPPALCGLRIVNAGIGGAKSSTLLAIADKMQATPALIVVSVGVNDAEDAAFTAKYSLLLDTLPRTRIAVATMAQPGFENINKAIKTAANENGAHLIDLGSLKDFKTRDGIHPVYSSYAEWRERLLDGVRHALNCE
ncbi:GDSL-type esterase/lipase family protein [Bradyrhizobium sp. RT4b]|uniref:SGNH/GDSL hydrolase family protein n=1 Tax=Bradyrhizobium sp. RT4b TaxID=3156379 RepID=UPI0033946BE0